MKKTILVLIGLFLVAPYGIGQATKDSGVGIRRIVITKRHAAFGGTSFGSAGPYEMLVGTAYGELDPKAPMNSGIVNLQYAPVNDRGHVEYSVDITILKPIDIDKGNGRLIYDVLNRGHEKALSDLNLSKFSSIGPDEVSDPATAYIMKRGYTVAWSGWEAEDSAETSRPGLQKAKFPVAMRDGKPIVGMSHEELMTFPAGPSFTKKLTYPAANLDTSAATLTVREHLNDPRKTIPSSDWSYVDAQHVRIKTVPGMGTEAIYELFYPATNPVVEGMAFASVRDFVLFARSAEKDSTGQPNPLHTATPYKAVLAVGISESGRFLRDMVYQDFNVDDSGHLVFDGMLSAVTGSRKTNVNTSFRSPAASPVSTRTIFSPAISSLLRMPRPKIRSAAKRMASWRSARRRNPARRSSTSIRIPMCGKAAPRWWLPILPGNPSPSLTTSAFTFPPGFRMNPTQVIRRTGHPRAWGSASTARARCNIATMSARFLRTSTAGSPTEWRRRPANIRM
jgi:hypothetical protein